LLRFTQIHRWITLLLLRLLAHTHDDDVWENTCLHTTNKLRNIFSLPWSVVAIQIGDVEVE